MRYSIHQKENLEDLSASVENLENSIKYLEKREIDMKSTSAQMVESWGEVKTVMEWLDDKRCHPEVTYDVLRRRLSPSRPGPLSIPEMALITPVIKGASKADSKQRIHDRKLKQRERYKMFVLCQAVRAKYNSGVDKADIKQRYDLTESMYNKIIAKQYGYNWAWDTLPGKVPDIFKPIKDELEYVPGAKDGLEKYATGEDD